jgi:hypothetical protein
MATNYTTLKNGATQTLIAARFNTPLQELDDAIEGMGNGTDALPSPSIVDFTNSQHDHADAAGGGLIEGDDLAFTGADDTEVVAADGADGAAMGSPLILPTMFREGLRISRLSDTQALIGVGSVMVGSVMVNKSIQTVLDVFDGDDWVRGNPTPIWDALQHIYCDESGNIKFSDLAPNASAPSADNLICTMYINQSSWNGTSGQGLGGYTIIYDDGGGGDPAGAANVAGGMLVGVYGDSGRSVGRGKGSGEGAAANFMSFMQVVSIDTDNNTLGVVDLHGIALNDNDVLAVIEDGPVIYRYDEAKWWRWLGAIYYDASDGFLAQYADQVNEVMNTTGDQTTISTDMVTLWSLSPILTQGGDVLAHVHGVVSNSGASGFAWIGISVDGRAPDAYGSDGYFIHMNPDVATVNRPQKFSFTRRFTNLPPGTHTFALQMDTNNVANTTTFHTDEEHPQFWAKEVANGAGY